MSETNVICFGVLMLWLCCCRLAVSENNIAKPGCQEKCGNVSIPYPFGIGPECALNSDFQLECKDSYLMSLIPGPIIDTFRIYNISYSQLYVSNFIVLNCYNYSEEGNQEISVGIDLNQSPFSISNENRFIVVGCDDYGRIYGKTPFMNYTVGCMALCSDGEDEGDCSGIGCCRVPVPSTMKSYNYYIGRFRTNVSGGESNRCGFGFLAKEDSFRFGNLSDLKDPAAFRNMIQNSTQIVWDWAIGELNCSQALNRNDFACKGNTTCVDPEFGGGGYVCQCIQGFQGNPYLEPGCQDIDECSDSNLNHCDMKCTNAVGYYNCSCPDGYEGDGIRRGTRSFSYPGCFPLSPYHPKTNANLKIVFGLSGGVGSLLLLFFYIWLYKIIQKRKEDKQKQKFFKQNGGLLWQQKVSTTNDNTLGNTKHFPSRELEKATDNFNENRILGKGGQGVVYKGMLSDGKIVAIKKSKLVDENQLEQFINEVVILSQINHRNIVKLLGCCLETEVPLLIYEFIPNGTLYDLIHDKNSEFPVSWSMRVKIAADVAGALAYLHSAASLPIYHRDVKTSNILLDERYVAKVSDFGTSKSVETDQSHVTTIVKGTFGNLDPEYFQSNQFTEKSDVYSFGVVLVELLTGKRPLSVDRMEQERSLATKFLTCMECDCLDTILDTQVLEQSKREEVDVIAKLARRCLNLSGKKRPTMKEVATELENVRLSQIPEDKSKETEPNEAETITTSNFNYRWTGGGDIVSTSSTIEEHPLIFDTNST